MSNEDYRKLQQAHEKILIENMDALDNLNVKVVSSKIELSEKYGWRYVIILQSDDSKN